jgi:hypothetical protein
LKKQSIYHLDIEIDKLTNSVLDTISGESLSTNVLPITKSDLKIITKKNGWLFSWSSESKFENREIFKLVIRNNPTVIQGLMSISDYEDHYYLHLVESSPSNLGREKRYEGVPGNLFAFACKTSWDKGYEGFVSFTSKTKLIEHYEKSLGATHVGGHKMIIFPHEALKLIQKYYPS